MKTEKLFGYRFMTNFCLLLVLVFSLPSRAVNVASAASYDQYYFYRSWGDEAINFSPSDVAVSIDNHFIYATDPIHHRIIILDRIANTVRTIGKFGQNNGEFINPCGIATDNAGNIYVADNKNPTVQIFSSSGQFLRKLDPPKMQYINSFFGPSGISVAPNGDIYIFDTDEYFGNTRLIRYNNSGQIIAVKYVDPATSEYSFGGYNYHAIATDHLGNVYVTVADKYKKYSPDFTYILEWKISNPTHINSFPRGIATDKDDNVYIVDTTNNRIQKYTSEGIYIKEFGSLGGNPGQFTNPGGIDIDNVGNIYVANTENKRIEKVNNDGGYIYSWGASLNYPWSFNNAKDVAVDRKGRLFVADTQNYNVKIYDPDGNLIKVQKDFNAWYQFPPTSLKLDPNDNIYVTDHGWLFKFDSNFNYVSTFSYNGRGFSMFDFTINSKGNVVIANSDQDEIKILIYSPEGNLLSSWGQNGPGIGQLASPRSIAVDQNNNIYIVEGRGYLLRIQKFSETGTLLGYWINPNMGSLTVNDIAVRNDGTIFVTDSTAGQIYRFNQNWEQLESIGLRGNQPGELYDPLGIAIAPNGNIFVSDAGNGRIVEFTTTRYNDPAIGLIENGDFEQIENYHYKWTYNGVLPITAVDDSFNKGTSLLLGQKSQPVSQGQGEVYIFQTLYVDPAILYPTLSFKYNIFTNDIIDYSDFFVEITDGNGHNHLATVLRAGYVPLLPGIPPTPGKEMGWRSILYDLSSFRSQYIRVVFHNRNLWPGSWGIWTQVDDVKILNSQIRQVYLPTVQR